MKKRIVCILLCVVMLVLCIPSAASEGGVTFPDVKESAWYYNAVTYCAGKGIFNGNKDGTFAPGKSITRAEFAVVLASYSGEDYSNEETDRFQKDIKPSNWYYRAIAWATNHGVVPGVDSNHFVPNREITRQDICVMLQRFLAYRGLDPSWTGKYEGFDDGDKISYYARDAVYTINAIGVISGMGNNTLNPKGNATRAQVAQMMMKFDEYMESNMSYLNLETIDITIPGVTKEYKFMHISDTHLTLYDETDDANAVSEMTRRGAMFDTQVGDGIKREDKLADMYALAEREGVDQILLTGDIIDAPSNGNMKYFADTVANSSVPSLYCLGNHDWTFETPYQTQRWRYIDGFRDIFGNTDENWWDDYFNVYEYEGFVIVSIDNSNDQVPAMALPMLQGYADEGMPVILMLHVPISCETAVADVTNMWGRDITLGSAALNPNQNTKKFVNYLRTADSPVVAILAGHTHLSHIDDVSPNNDTVQFTLGASFEGYTRIFNIKGE